MAVSQGFGKTTTSGTIFTFDVGDVVNSYKGEPTTNLSYNNGQTDSQYLASTITWVNAGSWTQNTNETDVAKPVILGFNTTNYRITSGLNTTAGGSVHYGCAYSTVNPSTTYTVSVWFRQNRAGSSQPYLRTNVTNVSLGNLAYNGDTNSANWPVNTWIRISASGTTASNENGVYISNYIGGLVGDKIWYFGHQVEAKSYATSLVGGTRSATQGLLPLVGNQSINLSNVSFNSNGIMYFDGTNDYIQVSYSESVSNAVSRSWEAVVKPTSTQTSSAIFGQKVSSGCTYFCNGGLYISSGKWAFNWYDNASYQFLESTVTATSNTTYHIVGTYDATDQKPRIYVNGNLTATYGSATNMNYASSVGLIDIGWTSASGGFHYFLGEIPVVKYYTGKALSLTEVKQNYNVYKSRFNIT